MNLENLHHIDPRRYSARINTALDWLRAQDFSILAAGRYDIDSGMRAEKFSLTTRPRDEIAPEVHRDHIDIQYLIRGIEVIACRLDGGAITPSEAYDPSRDVAFYPKTLDGESLLHLQAGDFAILYPGEIHRPGCGTGNIVDKIVIKIRFDTL